MEGDRSPKELLQLRKEPMDVVLRVELRSVRIHHGLIPLIGRAFQKLTRVEELTFKIRIGILITHQEMDKFHFE